MVERNNNTLSLLSSFDKIQKRLRGHVGDEFLPPRNSYQTDEMLPASHYTFAILLILCTVSLQDISDHGSPQHAVLCSF